MHVTNQPQHTNNFLDTHDIHTQICFIGSGERGESDPESECAPQAPASEDEFAEDELSLGEQGGHLSLIHI